MTCREMFARLSEFLDQELGDDLAREIEAHLEGCEPCDAFCQSLRQTVELCRALPSNPIPEDLRREVAAFLERECRPPSRS